jgi:predicted dehydrogenase
MIHFALVGCGGMAHWHAQQMINISEAKVVALVDIIESRAEQFREKYFPDAQVYDLFDKMLEKPPKQLDAVLLVTPHNMHHPHAKAALQRGLHVLCEKPMVTSLKDAYDLWRTVEQTRKLLGITFQAPYTREYTTIAGMRDAGEMGNVQIISGWVAQDWLPRTRDTWRQDPAQSGGGQMYDSGAHVLNGMMWIMNSPVVEVGCFYNNAGSPVDINGVAIMKFANGAIGSVGIGGNGPHWEASIQLQTDKLIIKTAPHGGTLDITTHKGRKVYPHVETDDHPSAHTPHLNFVRAILGTEPLRSPVRYGALLSALMDALYQSAEKQQIVRVEPVPEKL